MMTRNRTEELKLVFSLREAAESKEVMFGEDNVKFQGRISSIDNLDALRALIGTMRSLDVSTIFKEGGNKISSDSILKKIEKIVTWVRLETDDISLQFGVVSSHEHCFITVQDKTSGAAGNWEILVKPFLSLSGFVQAWVSDVEYNFWQNAKDPAEYEISGRDCSRLPMKSNGLPPPVQRMEIDISGNPGRWMLRSGYVEAVGAVMWLGEAFWARVGPQNKIGVKSTEWLRTSEPETGVLRVQVSEHCFIDDDTESAQERLRALLYS